MTLGSALAVSPTLNRSASHVSAWASIWASISIWKLARLREGTLARIAFALILCVAAQSSAQSKTKLNQAIAEIEADAQELLADPVRPKNLKSDTFVEERLTDGELFYRLKDYLRASIIFTDIVEHYQTHRAYPDAVFLLGESLFQVGDYLGAKGRYAQVIDRADANEFKPFVQKSLGRLIEIAIKTRNFDGVEGYFQRLSQVPSSELEAITAYFRAKYLYNKAVPSQDIESDIESAKDVSVRSSELEQARSAFAAIALDGPYGVQAKYFVGVIHTLRSEFPQAIETFRGVLAVQAPDVDQRIVIEQTYLALGRLYYETEQLDQAANAYQAVARTSQHFPTALYEIAWVYIRLGDAIRAERALEVLAVAAPSSPLIPDAKVLRANLLLRNGRLVDAQKVFREIRNEFGPIRRELDDIRAENPDLHSYFRSIVRENMDNFNINDFLPEQARRWVKLEGDYDRALRVLADLSTAKRFIEETDELIVRLRAALQVPNRVGVFTDLRQHQERATALRNRIAQARGELAKIVSASTSANNATKLLRSRREALQAKIAKLPVDEEDFVLRDGVELDEYRALQRALKSLRVEVQGLEARMVAASTVVDATEGQQLDTAAIRQELERHQAQIDVYRGSIKELERAVQVQKLHVGVGDVRYTNDEILRKKFNAIVDDEMRASGYASVGSAYRRLAVVERKVGRKEDLIRNVGARAYGGDDASHR